MIAIVHCHCMQVLPLAEHNYTAVVDRRLVAAVMIAVAVVAVDCDCNLLTILSVSSEILFALWLWHPEICHPLWVLVGGETLFLFFVFFRSSLSTLLRRASYCEIKLFPGIYQKNVLTFEDCNIKIKNCKEMKKGIFIIF